MSAWQAKRFWEAASTEPVDGGYGIALDGRPVNTPGKSRLVVPTAGLAARLVVEWDAQEDVIDPGTMPFTRLANSAIEKVAPQRDAVAEMLVGYGDSDLVCYRADGPERLQERQAEAWDPLLNWAEATFGGRLIPVEGVMYKAQPERALAALAAPVTAMDAFELTGFHELVTLSGSLVIGLAAWTAMAPPDALWDMSRIDESWQQEQWGIDEEAAEAAAAKAQDFLNGFEFLQLLKDH